MAGWFRVGQRVRYTNKKHGPAWPGGVHPLQDRIGMVVAKSRPGGIQNYLVDFGDRREIVSGWNLRRIRKEDRPC